MIPIFFIYQILAADMRRPLVRPTRPPRLSESDGGQAWPNQNMQSLRDGNSMSNS
jgi:hypothetical protein